MNDVVTWVMANGVTLIAILGGIVTVASMIANLTPTETDNKIVAKVAGLVNLLALNFKKPPQV
jgi:hypothetical protein